MPAEKNLVSKLSKNLCNSRFMEARLSNPFGVLFRRTRRPFRVRHLPLFPIPFKPFALPFASAHFAPFDADDLWQTTTDRRCSNRSQGRGAVKG